MRARIILGIVIGGGAGFALGYIGKCASGVCPLTSSPTITTAIGAVVGLLIAQSTKK